MLSEFDAKKQSKDEYDQQLIDFKPFIAYVHESKENDDQMSRDKLLGDCGMILGAATDTTATTLEFCILVAIKYPDIQEKIHKELTDVLGDKQSDITLKIEVYNKLNLLRAFIHEVLRLFAPGPLGGIRHTDKNYIVNDYVISKGSIVAININAINKDYRFWNNAKSNDDMNEIHLNYWLDKDGKFIKNESFYTFAYGKRDCVGRNLAMRELMIILSHLFMRYKFKNGGDEIWDIKYKVEHLLHALPMNVDIELRS